MDKVANKRRRRTRRADWRAKPERPGNGESDIGGGTPRSIPRKTAGPALRSESVAAGALRVS